MQIWNPSASFTRPADTTQYSIGDLIANSTTAGSVTPMSFALGGNNNPGCTRITRFRISKSGTGVTTAQFRLHLYSALPTVANGDNGAWSSSQAANYLGALDGPATLKAFTDGAADVGGATAGSEMMIRLNAGQTLFGLLANLNTYTPASAEVFTVTLECVDAW